MNLGGGLREAQGGCVNLGGGLSEDRQVAERSGFAQGRRGGWDCHLCQVKRNPKLYSTRQDP